MGPLLFLSPSSFSLPLFIMDKGKTPVNDASLATDVHPTIADLLGGSSITSTKLNSSSNFL